MRRSLTSIVLLAIASTLWAPGASASSPPAPPGLPPFPVPNAVAQIYPYEGHQGDPIYVSGRGFRPNTQLYFLLACPSYSDARTYQMHNYLLVSGPKTRRDGSFVAYRFTQKLYLHGENSSSCLLYVNYQDQPASDFPVPYNVVAYEIKLPRCVSHICARVSPHTVQKRGRLYERISVQTVGPPIGSKRRASISWVGASALISVTYLHLHSTVTFAAPPSILPWDGSVVVYIPLPGDVPQHVQGRVHVSFRLGRTKGDQFTRFTIHR